MSDLNREKTKKKEVDEEALVHHLLLQQGLVQILCL